MGHARAGAGASAPMLPFARRALLPHLCSPGDGVFGAMMSVALVNDGPVTFLLDSLDPNNQSLSSGGSVAGSLSSLDAP